MKNCFLFFFIIVPSLLFSQEQKLAAVMVDSIPMNADAFVGYDKFGFAYFIKDNTFIKIKDGKTSEYNNLSLGKIGRADIENPLLVVLFYEAFNSIVLLDNQMNEVRKISFSELNIPIVAHAAGLASQNRLWIYDSLAQQIGLYDYTKNTYLPITTPFQENLEYYQTDYNQFRWIDSTKNQYTSDVFGKISIIGKIDDFETIQFLSDTRILFQYNGNLHLMDWKKDTVYTISGIGKSFKKFYYKDQILSIFTDKGITNYKLTIP